MAGSTWSAIASYKVTDSVRLHGQIVDVQVAALTVTDPAIVAVVQLRGAVTLELTP